MDPDRVFEMLENAPCGVYAVSIDQRILFWNHVAETILGHARSDVLGRRCYEIFAGVTAGSVTPECLRGCPSIRYLREGLIPHATRLRMRCASGERKWVSVIPMVVPGVLSDAPLVAHLFDEIEPVPGQDLLSEQSSAAPTEGAPTTTSDLPPDSTQEGTATLSAREGEVLHLMALGWETPRIAAHLGISPHTVRNHIRNLRGKLKATSKLEAVVIGIRQGIVFAH